MKLAAPPKWYVEWDGNLRAYAVKQGEFTDSLHPSKYLALQRIVQLEEGGGQRLGEEIAHIVARLEEAPCPK